MAFDLHSHTTYSDGHAGPFDLARMAWASGLEGLAVSDHDTTAHFEEAAEACATFGLSWVPAVELSAEVAALPGAGGSPRSVHLLAYFVDAEGPLSRELERLQAARRDRALAMVAALNAHGADIDPSPLLEMGDSVSLGRPHVARLMVRAGLVPTTGQAFVQWLGEGCPAYVPKGALDPVRCVELVRASGGAAVLAHPTWGGVDRGLLDAMCTAGLAGIESPRDQYEPDAARAWRRIAAQRGLVVTHGSDFHGEAQSASMGSISTPVPMVEALRTRAEGEVRTW
ncbi:putative metal-dependent phosphoesterase [Euzebya pacifica]|uniref:Putative metal-dependent phosphoesterase n=1 Tax=Euzebya pacifica TaxID=1608957 RepID=A0A346XUD0_9ACTN|nr:PHP domain-containing protein [Euzebya pacifica]AXV05827.1 putative metal-dependent phosphoesterase [Euzebya pacifica]